FAELLTVFVIGVMKLQFRDGALQGGIDVRLVAAIKDAKLLEVHEHGERRLAVPAVANRLKVIVAVVYVSRRLLGFDEEAHITKVWREKSIIGALAAPAHIDVALDL